jgi:aminoglycoside phosphotransferase (APT) family kinase protein
MATGAVRDEGALRDGLGRWLRDRYPDRDGLAIAGFDRASAGFSNETVLLTVAWSDAGARADERLVVRIPAVEPMHPDCDLDVEAATHAALAAAGVPAPVPSVVEHDDAYLGVDFLVMPFVAGHVGPQTPVLDPWLLGLPPGDQRRVAEAFVDLLATVHRVDVAGTGLAPRLHGPGGSVADEVAWWARYVDWAGDGDPAPGVVGDLLAWCAEHVPASEPPAALLWGDARVGNTIFDAGLDVAAALDWDMAFVGPPEHDLGWYLSLDELTCELLDRRVPGFPDRDATVARYEQRLGRPVVDLGWYEIFALVRSIAVAYRLHRLATGAGRADVMPPPDRSPVVTYAQARIAAFA